jgi:hypothetical protein
MAAFGLGGALLTHTFALLSFAPLLVTFVLFRLGMMGFGANLALARQAHTGDRARSVLRAGLLAGGAGLGALLLIGTFLLPLVLEGRHLEHNVYVEETYHYRNHFVQVGQLFSPFWGFGYSDDPTGANDGMGFQIGLLPLGLALVAVFQLVKAGADNGMRRGLAFYLLLVGTGLALLMTPVAAPIWDRVGPLALIQFPWRLLSLVAFVGTALAGLVIANLLRWQIGSTPADGKGLPDQNEISAGAILLTVVVIFASFGYVGAHLEPVEPWREDGRAVFRFEQEHPDMIAYTEWVDEAFRTSPMTLAYGDPEYTEARARAGLLPRLSLVSGTGEILAQRSGGSSAGGRVRMDETATLRVHLLYFPGWYATLNGEAVDLRISPPHGLIELDVPPGEHEIDVRMGTTPARTLGTLLSWTAFLVLGFLWSGIRLRRPRA